MKKMRSLAGMNRVIAHLVVCCALIAWCSYLPAQSTHDFILTYDHQALLVSDPAVSVKFYTEVLGYTEIENLTGNPRIRWVAYGPSSQLHLITGDTAQIRLVKTLHFAVSTDQLDEFIAHLERLGIPYYDWPGAKNKVSTRADGKRQVYIQDPDGYWIEINNSRSPE